MHLRIDDKFKWAPKWGRDNQEIATVKAITTQKVEIHWTTRENPHRQFVKIYARKYVAEWLAKKEIVIIYPKHIEYWMKKLDAKV